NIGKSSHDLLARVSPENVPAALVGQSKARLTLDKGMYLLEIAARNTPLNIKLMVGKPGSGIDPQVVFGFAVTSKPAVDLTTQTNRPPPLQPPIKPRGKLGNDDGPFAVDEITLPTKAQMPSRSWMRLSGFDFFKNGHTAAVCTWNGDVWLV